MEQHPEHRWKAVFESLWRTIATSDSLQRLPPRVGLRLSKRVNASQCARIEWGTSVRILVSTWFANNLHEELSHFAAQICRLAFASPASRKRRQAAVLSAIEEVAISFVLLHELFHLMGGHLDWLAKKRNIAQFDEDSLGLAFESGSANGSQTRPTRASLVTSYVLESEADCNAIQWLIQHASLGRLSKLLRTKQAPVMHFRTAQRHVAFRLALGAVWLVIRRMEASRAQQMQSRRNTHPLPITRLFMAFGTFVQEYSVISEIHFDEEGGGQHTLSDEDVRSMRDFLKQILGPILKTDWNPEKSIVPMQSLEGQMTLYFPDFANHMLNREVTTDVGREMLEMEKARFRMDRALKPYRYFPVAELKRMQR